MMSKIIFPVTKVKYDVYIPICEYLENNYPQFVDFKKCFKYSIFNHRVDCYDYFKNKVNITTINVDSIPISNLHILNDIYYNYPQIYEKINVPQTLYSLCYENEAVHLVYMMGLLSKITDEFYIDMYLIATVHKINQDPNYISCEAMDMQIINIIDTVENYQKILYIKQAMIFFYEYC